MRHFQLPELEIEEIRIFFNCAAEAERICFHPDSERIEEMVFGWWCSPGYWLDLLL